MTGEYKQMKIIASDFDGTLYRHSEISARDREAIARWQAAGNLFGLVTGRGGEIAREVSGLGVALDFTIAHNGAVILDRDGKVLRRDAFDAAIAKDYFDFAYDESGYTFQYEKPDTDKYTGLETQIALLLHTQEDAQSLCEKVNERFGDRLNSFTNGWWINTVAKGVSKASGIAHFAAFCGVSRENIFVVGDSYNDLSMLTVYDGYIVATADAGMKRLIPNVCEDIAHLTEIAGE